MLSLHSALQKHSDCFIWGRVVCKKIQYMFCKKPALSTVQVFKILCYNLMISHQSNSILHLVDLTIIKWHRSKPRKCNILIELYKSIFVIFHYQQMISEGNAACKQELNRNQVKSQVSDNPDCITLTSIKWMY